MVHSNILLRIIRIFIKIPCLICTAHNTSEGGTIRTLLYRYTDKLADISTNVSQEAVDEFVKIGATKPGRMIPVYNGIDTDKFRFSNENRYLKRNEIGLSEDDFIFISVGRLEDQKDYPNLLKAFSFIIKDKANINNPYLIIIGDGYLKESLVRLSIELGIQDNIYFLGVKFDVEQWMSIADCYVLPSRYEGFGLVVAEAMSCERVVVATDCGGVSEVVNDFGFLVPPNNSKLLFLSMMKVLNLKELDKKSIGDNAREHIKNTFSLISVTNRWLEIYNTFSKKR